MSIDHYRTIRERAEFRNKIERSEFLGIAFPCDSDDRFFTTLREVEKNHFDATHHCWAFRLVPVRARSSDAGEPSGTAGKPILAAIEGADLYNVGVIVVRWYGGVKLGTGGLSRAYRETAAETLRRAEAVDRYLYERFIVRVPFDKMGAAYRLANPPHIVLAGEDFGEQNAFRFDVRRSRVEDFRRMLTEKRFDFTPP
jgi:uncharacterized YigZ family protein